MTPNPKDRLLSDPPDRFGPASIRVRLSGLNVHETVMELHPSIIPQKDDQIVLPDGSGRLGHVKYRLYSLDEHNQLIITIHLEV